MCTPASTALFACPSGSDCVQVVPAYPPGGDTSAGSFGNKLVCTPASNSLIACPGLCPSQVERNNEVPLFAVDARNT